MERVCEHDGLSILGERGLKMQQSQMKNYDKNGNDDVEQGNHLCVNLQQQLKGLP